MRELRVHVLTRRTDATRLGLVHTARSPVTRPTLPRSSDNL